MTRVQIIDGDFTITDPEWPIYAYSRAGDVLISDDFTIAGWLGGQDTDSALGGSSATWTNARYVSQAWQVTGGQAVWNKTGTVFLPVARQDYDLETKIAALPTAPADVVNLQARREEDTQKYVSAVIRGSGQITIKHYSGSGSITESSPSPTLVTAGDVVTLRVIGESVIVLINGSPILSDTVAMWTPNQVALNATSAAGAKIDYLKILAR